MWLSGHGHLDVKHGMLLLAFLGALLHPETLACHRHYLFTGVNGLQLCHLGSWEAGWRQEVGWATGAMWLRQVSQRAAASMAWPRWARCDKKLLGGEGLVGWAGPASGAIGQFSKLHKNLTTGLPDLVRTGRIPFLTGFVTSFLYCWNCRFLRDSINNV